MEIELFDPERCDPHAVVREEDVQLILAADATPCAGPESFRELEREAMETAGQVPGSVIVRAGRPLILLAVIHDLDRDPSWCEEWILAATESALRHAYRRGLTRISMPLLGTVHGRLPGTRAAELLLEGLSRCEDALPWSLWLETPDRRLVDRIRRQWERHEP